MPPTRILIVEDHDLVRAGLRLLLEGMPDITIIGEAADGRSAVEQARELRPDVVLMDIAMPGLNGMDATAQISRETPGARIIIVSIYSMDHYVLQSFQAGAAGYVLKDSTPAEIADAIRKVSAGEVYLSARLSPQVVDIVLHGEARTARIPTGPFEQLTPRQREVLQLIADGHTSQQIAEVLTISVKTVQTYRQQIMERLDIHDIPGLVRYALRTGLVSDE